MKRQMMTAKDIMDVFECGESKAYEIIRKLNKELDGMGYITISGKVPTAFFNDRFYGGIGSGSEQ